MAKDKKSFLLYIDLIHTVSKMPDDKAGILFKHILDYVNDNNPVTDDLIIQLTFEPIKQHLKRDLIKFEKTCIKNKNNVSIRWNKIDTKNTSGKNGIPLDTKHTDSDSDSDINILFSVFWDLYEKKIDAKKSELKWNNLNNKEREYIISYIPKYKISQPDKKFRKDPCTFLNNKSWLNEIVEPIKPVEVKLNWRGEQIS